MSVLAECPACGCPTTEWDMDLHGEGMDALLIICEECGLRSEVFSDPEPEPEHFGWPITYPNMEDPSWHRRPLPLPLSSSRLL